MILEANKHYTPLSGLMTEIDPVYVKTDSGQYLKHTRRGFQDSYGRSIYPKNYDEGFTVLSEFPHLQLDETFQLLPPVVMKNGNYQRDPKFNSWMPNQYLNFVTASGFHFLIQMKDYRITIPVRFQPSDPRLSAATGFWSVRTGRILHPMLHADSLHIEFTDNKFVLHIENIIGWKRVPSEPMRGTETTCTLAL